MERGGPVLLVRPLPCSPRPDAAPPNGAYHSWAGALEVATEVMELLPEQQLSSTV